VSACHAILSNKLDDPNPSLNRANHYRNTKMRSPTTAETTLPPGAHLEKSVVMVGLMGTGKTSIGRMLAKRLKMDFVDADAEIVAAAGCSIEEIFETHGEPSFRSGERSVIARLLDGPVRIIATGGGAFMDPETREHIAKNAISVWLHADLDTLVKRVSRRGGRPLIKNADPRQVIDELMKIRDPIYAKADIRVETSDDPSNKVTEQVIAALEDYTGLKPLAAPKKTTTRKMDTK